MYNDGILYFLNQFLCHFLLYRSFCNHIIKLILHTFSCICVKHFKYVSLLIDVLTLPSLFQEAFGFIERGDVVKEIFFHYSEFKGDLEALQAGDDVEFSIKERNVRKDVTYM